MIQLPQVSGLRICLGCPASSNWGLLLGNWTKCPTNFGLPARLLARCQSYGTDPDRVMHRTNKCSQHGQKMQGRNDMVVLGDFNSVTVAQD